MPNPKHMSAAKAQKKLQKAEKLIGQLVEAGSRPGAAEFYGVEKEGFDTCIKAMGLCLESLTICHNELTQLAGRSTNDEIVPFGPGDKG